MRRTILAGAAAAVLLLSACSDDTDSSTDTSADTTEATTTTAADGDGDTSTTLDPELASYCGELQALGDDEDPGFDQFFADHPEPTLEDWAEFLPAVIEQMDGSIAQLEEIEAPEAMADEHAAVIAAISTVQQDFVDGLAAAEAGDQAAYDAAEEKNQGGDSAAMEEAMGVVGAACGMPEG